MTPRDRPLTVLLVEDDDVAAEAVARSFRRHGLDLPLVVAQDGAEALEILRGVHPTITIAKPYLVLLDLNMPRMTGFEFLEIVRADEALRGTVVFVLTTSESATDRARAYHEAIAGYMVKSAVGPQFAKLVGLLREYASTVVM